MKYKFILHWRYFTHYSSGYMCILISELFLKMVQLSDLHLHNNIKFILKYLLHFYLALRSSSLELFRNVTANAWIIVQFTCDEDTIGKSQNNCRRYLLLTDYGHVIQNFQATEWEPKSGEFPLVWKSIVFKWHFRSGFWYPKQSIQEHWETLQWYQSKYWSWDALLLA